jgi:hypothetical protein
MLTFVDVEHGFWQVPVLKATTIHYSSNPGDRNYEIETAVWIWSVSYHVL